MPVPSERLVQTFPSPHPRSPLSSPKLGGGEGAGGSGEGLPPVQVDAAVHLYEQLLDLQRKGINGIWARIIKNAFAPLFQGRFDYVAGNPPWVNWESLPDDYRQETKDLWVYHGLFPHSGMDTML